VKKTREEEEFLHESKAWDPIQVPVSEKEGTAWYV